MLHRHRSQGDEVIHLTGRYSSHHGTGEALGDYRRVESTLNKDSACYGRKPITLPSPSRTL